jgi:antirestriction protein ArdC
VAPTRSRNGLNVRKRAQPRSVTLGHELVHTTGHKDRLARKFNSKIFKDAYPTEELVAELGSAFLCALSGYCSYIEAQSPTYLNGWLKVLKEDRRAIFSIASYAP